MAKQKKNTTANKSTAAKKKANGSSTAAQKMEKNGETTQIPVRLITATVSLAVFALFFILFLNPEGALMGLLYQFVLGLVGKAGFYVAIPALLYLFIIQAFSGKRPVIARSVCLLCFILICGCMAQLSLALPDPGESGNVITALYLGGEKGTTAGLICGGIGLGLKWLCGTIVSYILLIIAALLTRKRQ